MRLTCNAANIHVKLVVHVAGGDWTIYNGDVDNEVGVSYTLPAWNGRNPRTGKPAPYAASYGWTLTITKDGQTVTRTGSVLLSSIYLQVKGTSARRPRRCRALLPAGQTEGARQRELLRLGDVERGFRPALASSQRSRRLRGRSEFDAVEDCPCRRPLPRRRTSQVPGASGPTASTTSTSPARRT